MRNNTAVTSESFSGGSDFSLITTPISFTAGQEIGFRTDTVSGSYNNTRVCVWLRVRSSVLSSSVLNDLLDVSLAGLTTNQILQYNGSNWVPIDLNSTTVGLGNVDNTSDLNKPISTAQQSALNLKYDASNPSNYVDATALANFETTTQLDARDSNNRNRNNHTGTQTASTISDIVPTIKSNETDTTLSLIGSTLRYVGENGANQDVVLSFVESVNGDTGAITNVAKTDEINTFSEKQVISDTSGSTQLNLKGPGPVTLEFEGNASSSADASLYYRTTPQQLILGGGSATTDILGIDTTNNTIQGFSNQAKNFANPTAAQDLATKRYIDLRNDAVKVTNTTTGNLNVGVSTFTNFTTTDQLGSTLGQFTLATTGITPNFSGIVEINFNIQLSGSSPRTSVGFRWSHNGSVGPWILHTYIRGTSGHTQTSANFSTLIEVTSGQAIQIQHDDFADSGSVISPGNGVEFTVRRIS